VVSWAGAFASIHIGPEKNKLPSLEVLY